MHILLKPFRTGVFLFAILLLGGVTIKQNGIAAGANTCYARTENRLPAAVHAVAKHRGYYNRLAKRLNPDNSHSRLGRAVIIILAVLVVAAIGFGIWSVALLLAAKYVAGILVGILSLLSLFGILKFLLS